MPAVMWPDRRADIINAVHILALLRPDTPAGWPGLTEAVHWLIDDTFWDQRDPRSDVGSILSSADEARAVSSVVSSLLTVLDASGPTRADDDYLNHPHWHQVTRTATHAHRLLSGQRTIRTVHPRD